MPVGSETETTETEVTVAVRDTTGPGGTTQFVDIVISVETGKVEAAAEPVGYTKYDKDRLCVWWHNVSIDPEDSVAKTLEVKRKDGEENEGPVEIVTVVTSKDGTYFDVQRRCLCNSGSSGLTLVTGLLARLKRSMISVFDEYEQKLT